MVLRNSQQYVANIHTLSVAIWLPYIGVEFLQQKMLGFYATLTADYFATLLLYEMQHSVLTICNTTVEFPCSFSTLIVYYFIYTIAV